MSFADVNATVTTPSGVTVVRQRGRVVHPMTPNLPSDTVVLDREGQPFRVAGTGATVKFGDIPIERRFAVGNDGKILEQRDFEDLHLEWYTLHFRAKGKESDDPTCRKIPCVEKWVSEVVAPDGIHYRTNGYDPNAQPESDVVVRPEGFSPVDPKTVAPGYEPVRESEAEKQAREAKEQVAALTAQVAKLTAAQGAGATPDPPTEAPAPETFAAACGKACKSKAGVKAHERNHGCADQTEAA